MKPLLNYFVLFIYSLSILVLAQDECPPEMVIAPCRCEKASWPKAIVCANITDVSTLRAMFEKSGDWPIRAFVLEYSNVMYIPAAAVVEKGFWYVTVWNSTLTSLFDVAPTVDNRLSHINLHDVKFQRGIRWDLMTNLRNILDIKIEFSEFRKLGKDFVDNVGVNLRKFMMEGTKTSDLHDHVFAKMKQMNQVHFRHCRISTLKRSMFANPSRMYTFDFRYNRLETLPDDMFHGMPHLYDIQLQGNRFKHFSECIFGGHMYDEVVMIILLHDNPITCDCSIRWFVNKERYVDVNAHCAAPDDKKGLHVRDLNPAWFNYCPRTNTLLDAIE